MATRLVSLGAALVGFGLVAGACSSGSDSDANNGENHEPAAGKVELSFWTWAPNMEKVADLWNQKHPDIQVTVNKQDGGDPAVTKLLTAIKAGKGAPDLMQAEYQKIPTLVANDALEDISGDLDDGVMSQFSDGVNDAVSLGTDAVYAIPQDTGPLAFFYREDVFQRLGLEAPTTWEEYAEAARKIHEDDPSVYLGTFSANDPGWFAGLTQQAGASWWSVDDDAWSVDIDVEATQKVAGFWGGLVQEGVINNQPMYTPAWNNALNTGKEVGWVSAIWAPGVLSGNAPKTAGKWRMALLPTWDGEPGNGAWGGSATGVTTQSEHPAEAAEFAAWLNTDPEAVQALTKDVGVYPAAQVGQDSLTEPPEFFSNQSDFYDLASQASDSINIFTYGPNVNVAYNAYVDAFSVAAEDKSQDAFLDALKDMQEETVKDMQDSGFDVSD